jgi:hypothetical protein
MAHAFASSFLHCKCCAAGQAPSRSQHSTAGQLRSPAGVLLHPGAPLREARLQLYAGRGGRMAGSCSRWAARAHGTGESSLGGGGQAWENWRALHQPESRNVENAQAPVAPTHLWRRPWRRSQPAPLPQPPWQPGQPPLPLLPHQLAAPLLPLLPQQCRLHQWRLCRRQQRQSQMPALPRQQQPLPGGRRLPAPRQPPPHPPLARWGAGSGLLQRQSLRQQGSGGMRARVSLYSSLRQRLLGALLGQMRQKPPKKRQGTAGSPMHASIHPCSADSAGRHLRQTARGRRTQSLRC